MTTTNSHIRSIENVLHTRYHVAPGFVVSKVVQILTTEGDGMYSQLSTMLKDAFPGETIAETSANEILLATGFTI